MRIKMMCHIAKVQSAWLSGMESYCMKDIDYRVVDVAMTRHLRAMLRGQAAGRSNAWVWKHWMLCPAKLELRVRIKWIKEMVKYPEEHGYIMSVLFGHPEFEKGQGIQPTIKEDGSLDEHANPFAKMLMEDLQELRRMASAEQFDEAWDGTFKQLLESEVVAGMLDRIDPAVMRADFWSGKWGDEAEIMLLHANMSGNIDCSDEGAYICEMRCSVTGEEREC